MHRRALISMFQALVMQCVSAHDQVSALRYDEVVCSPDTVSKTNQQRLTSARDFVAASSELMSSFCESSRSRLTSGESDRTTRREVAAMAEVEETWAAIVVVLAENAAERERLVVAATRKLVAIADAEEGPVVAAAVEMKATVVLSLLSRLAVEVRSPQQPSSEAEASVVAVQRASLCIADTT
jgi:hypothetical protein